MRQQTGKQWILVWALLCGRIISYAQPPERPDDFPVLLENAPDSSAGFQMLQKRLVPLPPGAKPVSIVAEKGVWMGGMHGVSIPREWVVGEGNTFDRLYAYTSMREGSIRMIKINKKNGFNINFDMNEVDFVAGETDLTENIRDIFELLASTDKNKEWEKKRFLNRRGELMLYATRLHELGHTDPANQLAAYLFENYSKRETILRTLSTLADEAYLDLLTAYTHDGDVEKFIGAVKTSLAQHQSYWEIAPSLRAQVAEWEQTIASTHDTIPAEMNPTLSEAQKGLRAKLVENPVSLITLAELLEDENWLLQPNALIREYAYDSLADEEEPPGVNEALEMLMASRQDFLNFCEAMLSDRLLIPYLYEYDSNRIEYSDDDEPPAYPQPYQVRNFAAMMLSGLAPDNSYWDVDEPAELLIELKTFRASTDQMDKLTLAQYYLDRHDDHNLPREAVYTLLSSKDPAIRKHAVGIMLQQEDTLDNALSILLDFHDYYPEESKAGLTKILAHLKTLDPEDAWEFGGPEGLKSNINTLETLLELQPVEVAETPAFSDALDQWLAAGDPDNIHAVISTLQHEKSSPQDIQKILAAHVQSQPMGAARILLNLQNMIIHSGGLNELQMRMYDTKTEMMKYYLHPENLAEADENVPTAPVWDKESWLPLLRASETDDQKMKAFMVAFAIVNPLQNSDAHYRFSHLFRGSGNDADTLLISWAKRYLEDPKDLSWLDDIPNPENLGPGKRQNIEDVLSGQDLPAARALLNAEDIEERLAALSASESNEAIAGNTALWRDQLDTKNRITLLKPIAGEADPVFSSIEMGEILSFDRVNDMIKMAKAEAQKGKNGMLIIRTSMLNQGVSLLHNRNFISKGYFQKSGIRIYGVSQDVRVSGEFSLDLDLQLKQPGGGEKKELNILELIEAGEDQQLETLGHAIYDWINTPVPPHETGGQITIIYCGEKPKSPTE
ncbi:hypothetical protein P0Y35_13610 [Kiritimatiellaeota bacterium B1221]|nr:hypothetical protein [Kiritimatiellaeota bacterium B1221]